MARRLIFDDEGFGNLMARTVEGSRELSECEKDVIAAKNFEMTQTLGIDLPKYKEFIRYQAEKNKRDTTTEMVERIKRYRNTRLPENTDGLDWDKLAREINQEYNDYLRGTNTSSQAPAVGSSQAHTVGSSEEDVVGSSESSSTGLTPGVKDMCMALSGSKRGTKRKKGGKSNKTKRMKKGGKGGKRGTLRKINNGRKSHLVRVFLEMLNVIKLYHWKTRSFSQHKATDELYSRMNEHIDKFVEVLLGKDQSRISMIEKHIDLLDAKSTKEFQARIFDYRGFLMDLDRYFDKKRDTDLLNIRDEILGDINQFLYLLTFDK